MNQKGNLLIIGAITVLVIIVGLFVAYHFLNKSNKISNPLSNPSSVLNASTSTPSVSNTPSPVVNTNLGTGLGALPIQIPILSSDLASLFTSLRSNDEAIFVFENYAPRLFPIAQGKIDYGYGSLSTLQNALPSIPSTVTSVIYNPEHDATRTPVSEWNNLVSTTSTAEAAVHAAGKIFELVPDSRFNQQYGNGAQLAPYTDIYIIQAQRYQGDLSQFDSYVSQETQIIKKANPKCKVWVQIQVATQTGTTAVYSPQGAMAAIKSLSTPPDGIGVWTFARQSVPTQQFISMLRSN